MSDKLRDRKCGCLYGLAVGDALGASIEFKTPGTFPLVTCYRDGGPHSLSKGQWTDDTSMALALAHSIGAGWNLDDQITRYLDWFQNGTYSVNGFCFDIGTTTRTALLNYERDHDVTTCADSTPGSSGNGSIMRLAPVPIAYAAESVGVLCDLAERSSTTTHASEQCKSACRYLGLILSGLINGEERDTVLSVNWQPFLDMIGIKPLDPLIMNVANGSFRNKTPDQIRGGGWVVHSLEAALWAFSDAMDFNDAVLRAVNLGDDSDTTGAVCGQLAGAYWGKSRIDHKFIDGLSRKDMIVDALDAMGVSCCGGLPLFREDTALLTEDGKTIREE